MLSARRFGFFGEIFPELSRLRGVHRVWDINCLEFQHFLSVTVFVYPRHIFYQNTVRLFHFCISSLKLILILPGRGADLRRFLLVITENLPPKRLLITKCFHTLDNPAL